jgi:RPA family protein
MEKRRVPAKKVRIYDVLNGKYFPGSKEEMKASYVITPFGDKVSRVNIIATVIEKFESEDGNYSSIRIDDGTEALRVKFFKEDTAIIKNVDVGDLATIIGKVKEYNGEVYINGEIVRKVDDVNTENLQKLEVLDELIEKKKVVDQIKNLLDEMSEEELKKTVKNKFGIDEEPLQVIRDNLKVVKEIDYKPKILEVIKSLDRGEGVEIGKILQLSDLPENVIENAINELLSNGSLFEPKPGILRKV